MLDSIKTWAYKIKVDAKAIYLAGCDARTPRVVKLMAIFVAAYALSPIDLIPDFIPVLGYLDDLIIVPVGISLVVKLMPDALMREFRLKAQQSPMLQTNRATAMALVGGIWLLCGLLIAYWVFARDYVASS